MASNKVRVKQIGDETIVAVITPPGEGGIAAIRIAGPASNALLAKHFRQHADTPPAPFMLCYGVFVDASGEAIDEVTAVLMPYGRSYTGLEQAEIFCHGGRQVVRAILDACVESGARPAEPGEFTKLAFLNGRIDLTRAEAVAEVIAANTDISLKAGREHLLGAYSDHLESLRSRLVAVLAEIEADIDFAEEDTGAASPERLRKELQQVTGQVEHLLDSYTGGRIVREGYRIAIAGRPNAGKSSLFNRLLQHERALVTPTAGTTRDYLSEWVEIDGLAVNLIDTAGLRRGGGSVEKAGQQLTRTILDKVDLVLWMADLSDKLWQKRLREDLDKLTGREVLVFGNKSDLIATQARIGDPAVLAGSCKTGKGLKSLRQQIVEAIHRNLPDLTSGLVVTSLRHQRKLKVALKGLQRTDLALSRGESPDIVAFELRQAVEALDEITGRIYTEEILGEIFGRFCIGK
jgi:tRNA modification GTPase